MIGAHDIIEKIISQDRLSRREKRKTGKTHSRDNYDRSEEGARFPLYFDSFRQKTAAT